MFDYERLGELDDAAVAALVSDVFESMVDTETRLLQLAVHWADRHGEDRLVSDQSSVRGMERPRAVGGSGTPWVMEFAAAELGPLMQTSTGGALNMIGDALDLRHRLPRLWERVLAGDVRVWKARKVAQATKHLGLEAAGYVDDAVTGYITSLPWSRFENLLEAKVIEADPAQAEARARAYEADRFVRTGRTDKQGCRTLIARAVAGDIIFLVATLDRIAEILKIEGDTDTIEIRRSKALGILAQPAAALQLLYDHQHDPDTHCPEAPEQHAPKQDAPKQDAPKQDASVHDGDAVVTDEAVDPDQDGQTGEGDLDSWEPAHHPDRHEDQDRVEDEFDVEDDVDDKSLIIKAPMVDPDKLRPKVTLYIHMSEEALYGTNSAARMEGVGAITLDQVRRFLGPNCQVRIQPVIDPANATPVDAYETPQRLREALHLRNPADIFPFASSTSRRMDIDHTIAYLSPDKGGPPRQTDLANLGPMTRFHHRMKTHGRWRLRQPAPGDYLWRSPLGWVYLVNNTGTHNLGNNQFAQRVWHAADMGIDIIRGHELIAVA